MALSGYDRAVAQYKITNIDKLSGDVDPITKLPLAAPKGGEKRTLFDALLAQWGADTDYLVAHTTVNPGTLNVATLTTAGSATKQIIDTPGLVAGTGTIS